MVKPKMKKSPEETEENRMRRSVDCFMRGEGDLNWIAGVIRSCRLRKDVLQDLFFTYRVFYAKSNFQSFQELEKKCKELGYI